MGVCYKDALGIIKECFWHDLGMLHSSFNCIAASASRYLGCCTFFSYHLLVNLHSLLLILVVLKTKRGKILFKSVSVFIVQVLLNLKLHIPSQI